MSVQAVRFRYLVLLIPLGLPLFCAGPAWGQNIVAQWNFDTGDPNGNGTVRTGLGYEAQTVDPNAMASDISIGDNIPDTTENWIQFCDPPYPTLVLRVPPGSGSSSPDLAVLQDKYIQFTVTANTGLTLNLSSLTFDAARGGNAVPRGWALLSDVDGFTNYIDTQDVPTVRNVLTSFSVDLSDASFQKLTEVTFRIYTYVPGSGQSIEYDNITLNGTVQ